MNKLLTFVPILLVLTLGAIAVANFHEEPLQASLTVDQVSFDSLRACQGKVPQFQCNTIDSDADFSLCQKAANNFALIASIGSTVPACAAYTQLFNSSKAQDLVNQNDNYYSCFTSNTLLSAVRVSPIYYNNVFAPKYLACANISL